MPPLSPISTERVQTAIASASARTGVPFDYLYNQAKVESGLNPNARARTSSAAGLFQFTRQTWLATLKAHGAEHGLGAQADAISRGAGGRYFVADPVLRQSIMELRDQPETASAMAAAFASDNRDHLASAVGRTVEPVDLYLAHFLGAGGATRFLKAFDADPDTAAAALLPQAAAANGSIFYNANGSARSVGDIRAHFAAKIGGAAPAPAPAIRAHSTTHSVTETSSGFASLRAIEPMPQRLSMAFAEQAYARLAGLTP
jgi:Transglycosylase SLT domain